MGYFSQETGENLHYGFPFEEQPHGGHATLETRDIDCSSHPELWHDASTSSQEAMTSTYVGSPNIYHPLVDTSYLRQFSETQMPTRLSNSRSHFRFDSYSSNDSFGSSTQCSVPDPYETQQDFPAPDVPLLPLAVHDCQGLFDAQQPLYFQTQFNLQSGVDQTSIEYSWNDYPQMPLEEKSDFYPLPQAPIDQYRDMKPNPSDMPYLSPEKAGVPVWTVFRDTPPEISNFTLLCRKCKDERSPGWNMTYYENISALVAHTWKSHHDIKTWKANKCLWEGCETKKIFTRAKNWLNHVRVVHQKNFWCKNPKCDLRQGGPDETPFGTQTYLDNHIKGVHHRAVFCRKPLCSSSRKAKLNRTDKLNHHNAKWHGWIYCDIPSCSRSKAFGERAGEEDIDNGFSTKTLLDEHVRAVHDGFQVLSKN